MGLRCSGRTARRAGIGFIGLVAAWPLLSLVPGVPVRSGPAVAPEVKAAGLGLFVHEWLPGDPMARGDGLGPVFNGRSCVQCHAQGGIGGAGGSEANVTAFEALPTFGRTRVEGGMIHKAAVEGTDRETESTLRTLYPVASPVPGRSEFDPLRVESINSTALFGAGWIDRISSRSILAKNRLLIASQIAKEARGKLAGAVAGRPRILPDGRVGKFGWKAQFATLDEFVAAACANEIGLGNPMIPEAKPLSRRHEKTTAEPDLGPREFASLVAFVSTLPRPVALLPTDVGARGLAGHGREVFEKVGCADCHTPDVGGVDGVYSDFMLHRLDDRSLGGGGYGGRELPPVPIPDDQPVPEEWRTPPLWGVADSAPYFHDGASPTLESAIRRHLGDAVDVTEAFASLEDSDRQAVLAFLKTLKAPRDAQPAPVAGKGSLVLSQ